MGHAWGPSGQLYGANMSNPYGGHTFFVQLLHMVPMWVAHPYGSQILHTVSTDLAHSSAHMGPIQFLSTCFIWVPCGLPLCNIGVMWVAHIGCKSCTHFPKILPIFLPLRDPYDYCPPVSLESHVGGSIGSLILVKYTLHDLS